MLSYNYNEKVQSKILERPQIPQVSFDYKLLSSRFEDIYLDLIMDFIESIKRSNPNWNFSTLYSNLSTISFAESNILTALNNEEAYYDWERNKIYYCNFAYLFRQLLYASTFTKKGNVYICGFQQADLRRFRGHSIGRGFNEGFTSLLEEKYFKSFTWSLMELSIARNIRKLGEKQIEDLYNKMDLAGLISFMRKFESEKEVFDFLQKLDYINAHQHSTRACSTEIPDLYYECQLFSFRCYIYKLLKELECGKIDFKTANSKLRLMINLSQSKLMLNGKFIEISRLEDLISNPLDLENISSDDIARFKLKI